MGASILGVIAVLVVIPFLWNVNAGSRFLSASQLTSTDVFTYKISFFWYVFVFLGGCTGSIFYVVPILAPHPGVGGWLFFLALGSIGWFAAIASVFRFMRAYLSVGTDVIRLKYKGAEKIIPFGHVRNVYPGAGGNTIVETDAGERILIPGFFQRRNEFLALIAYRSSEIAQESFLPSQGQQPLGSRSGER